MAVRRTDDGAGPPSATPIPSTGEAARTTYTLERTRRTLADPNASRSEVEAVLSNLMQLRVAREGMEPEDIALLDLVLGRRDLTGPGKRMALEVRRRAQERSRLLFDIFKEEQKLLAEGKPSFPPGAPWVAVRLGEIVARGPTKEDVERQVEAKQQEWPYFMAFAVEVGKPLRRSTRS